jgi:hypothetical protein
MFIVGHGLAFPKVRTSCFVSHPGAACQAGSYLTELRRNGFRDSQSFEDRRQPGDWRVEWVDDGGIEVTIFSDPNARERALRYADRLIRQFRRD